MPKGEHLPSIRRSQIAQLLPLKAPRTLASLVASLVRWLVPTVNRVTLSSCLMALRSGSVTRRSRINTKLSPTGWVSRNWKKSHRDSRLQQVEEEARGDRGHRLLSPP